MTDKIHPSLRSMAVDIDTLDLLDGNPRIGNVDAIMSSYEEFGQVKPIVARKNDDGTATVIAGNHQLQAAQALGWDKIAVVFLEADDNRAIAFAIADNRTMELGYTEPELLNEMLLEVSEYYPELMEGLGWDEFEIAAIENDTLIEENRILGREHTEYESATEEAEEGQTRAASAAIKNMVERDASGEGRIVAGSNLDHSDIAVRGSTVAVPGSAPQAAVQYTIVFDNADQQSRWYDFVRWLKNNPSIDGSTTAERLINFIDEHCEI
jgi:ParB-like chromosome segregation protein Spo0J